MIKKYGDIISGSFIIAVSVLIFVLSFSIKQFETEGVGAAFMPRVVSVFFLLLGIALVKGGIKTYKNFKEGSNEASLSDYRAVFYTLILLLLYVSLLSTVGFIIMSTIYLFLQFIIVSRKEERNFVLFGILSVVTSLGAYYLFLMAFNVILPSGILG